MITPDRKGWKRWRRAVKRHIKTSPNLRREFRRSRSNRLIPSTLGAFRIGIPMAIAVFLLTGQSAMLATQWMLLWTTLITFVRTQQISSLSGDPNTLWLWYGWPISDDDWFSHQQGLVVRAATWLGVDWLVFGLAMAWTTGDITLAIAAPVLALTQWSAALSVGLWLVRWKPRFPFGWMITPLCVVIFLAARSGGGRDAFTPYIDIVSNGLYLGTPAGWLTQGWSLLVNGNLIGWAVLLGLGMLSSIGLITGAKNARKAFNPDALFGYEPAPTAATDGDASKAINSGSLISEPEAVHRETAPVNLELLRMRLKEVFEKPSGIAFTGRSPIENGIGWFLTARQRVLVDFMIPGGLSWLRRWAIALGFLALTVVLRTTWPHHAIFPAALAMVLVLPVFGGRWLGFEAMRTFQTQIGLTAYVPAGFGELSRLVLKINALQCMAAFPLVMAALWLGFPPVNAPTWWALDYGARMIALTMALQPIWLLAKFSSNTNDSSSGRFLLVGIMIVILAGLIIGVSLCVTALMSDSAAVSLGCFGVLILLTHITLALYGWAWGRGWFDLMAKVK